MRCLVLTLAVLFAASMGMGQKAVPAKKPTAQSAKGPSPSAIKPTPEPWPPVVDPMRPEAREAFERMKEELQRRMAEMRAKQEAAIAADPSLAPKKFRPLLGVCAIPLLKAQVSSAQGIDSAAPIMPRVEPRDADPDALAPAPPDCPLAE